MLVWSALAQCRQSRKGGTITDGGERRRSRIRDEKVHVHDSKREKVRRGVATKEMREKERVEKGRLSEDKRNMRFLREQ